MLQKVTVVACDHIFHVRQLRTIKETGSQGWAQTIYSFMAEEDLGLWLYFFYFQEKSGTEICM